MKIPKIFIPEKNLEDKTLNLLENADCKSLEESFWTKDRDVTRTCTYSENWSSHKVRIQIIDWLQIRSDYCNDLHVVIRVPILKSTSEKDVGTFYFKNFVNSRKLSRAVNKVKKMSEKLEKHFGFDKLISKVQNDSELFSRIDETFKDFAPGDYNFEFKDDGVVSLEGRGLFTGAQSIAVMNLYHDCLSKYLVKDTGRNGFLYNLKTGIQSIFR